MLCYRCGWGAAEGLASTPIFSAQLGPICIRSQCLDVGQLLAVVRTNHAHAPSLSRDYAHARVFAFNEEHQNCIRINRELPHSLHPEALLGERWWTAAEMGRPRKRQRSPSRRQSSDSSGPESRLGHATTMPANDRERDRMRVQSAAFRRLKNTLPWVPPDTKLSKLDTLRMACCYITHLGDVLADEARRDDSEPTDVTTILARTSSHAGQRRDGRRLVNLVRRLQGQLSQL